MQPNSDNCIWIGRGNTLSPLCTAHCTHSVSVHVFCMHVLSDWIVSSVDDNVFPLLNITCSDYISLLSLFFCKVYFMKLYLYIRWSFHNLLLHALLTFIFISTKKKLRSMTDKRHWRNLNLKSAYTYKFRRGVSINLKE